MVSVVASVAPVRKVAVGAPKTAAIVVERSAVVTGVPIAVVVPVVVWGSRWRWWWQRVVEKGWRVVVLLVLLIVPLLVVPVTSSGVLILVGMVVVVLRITVTPTGIPEGSRSVSP